MSNKDKPLDLICIDPFKHEGKHYAVGDVLRNVPKDDALELAGAGRARLATEEEAAAPAGGKRAKAEA